MKKRETSPYLIVFSLWLLVFSASSQIMIISPILPQIGEQLHIADTLLGTLVTAYGASALVLAHSLELAGGLIRLSWFYFGFLSLAIVLTFLA